MELFFPQSYYFAPYECFVHPIQMPRLVILHAPRNFERKVITHTGAPRRAEWPQGCPGWVGLSSEIGPGLASGEEVGLGRIPVYLG